MSGFEIEVRFSEEHNGLRLRNAIRSWLNAFRGAVVQPREAMEQIGRDMTAATKRRFNIEMSPTDGKWARNSPVTIALKGHSKPLKGLTGQLRESIHYEVLDSGKAVSIGSPLPYAAMQQFGGTKAQFPHLWGDIPARPFLGRSEADQRNIRAVIRRYLGLPDD